MSRVIGEAKWDPTAGRWYFIIYIDNGDVIFESDHVFDSQEEAEGWLVKALRGLASDSRQSHKKATQSVQSLEALTMHQAALASPIGFFRR